MKKFKIKLNNGTVKVLETTRVLKVDGFSLKRGFFAFQDKETGEFLGFSSGWTCNGCLAIYVPAEEGFKLKWIGFDYETPDSVSKLDEAVFDYGFEFLR